ncbi:MAG: thioredoxin family protein [Candidatus Auribacterota bacterium]|jgi:small redox-active disulfide protein 2|nr:thioredoxin family protein [Candidatus Auribacterota bacterium]
MKIEILGTGCPKCKKMYDNVIEVLKKSGKNADVVKVEDIMKITEYGVMMTPALVVDGVVKSSGKLLSHEQIHDLLN